MDMFLCTNTGTISGFHCRTNEEGVHTQIHLIDGGDNQEGRRDDGHLDRFVGSGLDMAIPGFRQILDSAARAGAEVALRLVKSGHDPDALLAEWERTKDKWGLELPLPPDGREVVLDESDET